MEITIFFWVVGAIVTSVIASERGRRPLVWFVAALLLSPVVILVLFVLPKIRQDWRVDSLDIHYDELSYGADGQMVPMDPHDHVTPQQQAAAQQAAAANQPAPVARVSPFSSGAGNFGPVPLAVAGSKPGVGRNGPVMAPAAPASPAPASLATAPVVQFEQFRPAPAPRIYMVKSCPQCAETLKMGIRVCRYCGYDLEGLEPPMRQTVRTVAPSPVGFATQPAPTQPVPAAVVDRSAGERRLLRLRALDRAI